MCGIAGFIDFEGAFIDPLLLSRMNNTIRHRGRDDEGYVLINQNNGHFLSACGEDSPAEITTTFPRLSKIKAEFMCNIGLAHRRFSIVDLSPNGHQPFFCSDRSCCIIFNGEVYNYLELRQNLIKKGVTFCSNSDTEVFIEAYRMWGTDCFQKLNGFWAVAIYDFRRKQLVLSRDRMGKKPLYWARICSQVYFASEIKSLLQIPEINRSKRVNESAAYFWLKYGLRDLQNTTMFERIYSLPAASWVAVDSAFPRNVVIYWQVPSKRLPEKDVSIADASLVIKDILQDAVDIRLRADVPVAIELSGGMDSSALVALAARIHSEPIRTYTVRFPDKKWNEEPFARSVANQYKVDYQVIESPLDNFWIQIAPFTNLQEEPYHSPNLQTNQVIYTMMRAVGTKVSLNGAAGDELFAGYGGYFQNAQIENWRLLNIRHLIKNSLNWTEKNNFADGCNRSFIALCSESNLLFNAYKFLKRMKKQKHIKIPSLDLPVTQKDLTSILYSDMTNTKMPYWLRSGDKTHMGIPFEVRAPFLDYRLVEYAFSLPSSYLLRDGWHKWILRKALKDILPTDVLWRKRKMGFPFPYERFFKRSSPIIAIILKQANNPFIDLTQVHEIQNNWRALSFILWYEMFFNENKSLFDTISDTGRKMEGEADYGFKPEFLKSSVYEI